MLTVRRFLAAALLLSTSPIHAAEHPVAFLAYTPADGDQIIKAGNGVYATISVWGGGPYGGPYIHHPRTDLVRLNPDGTETVLVAGQDDAGGIAVLDFCVSLDGKSVLYSHVRKTPGDKYLACDLWRLNLADGVKTKLTDARNEWQPPSGAFLKGWDDGPQGCWNTSPCEVAGGRIIFTSNRNGARAPKSSYTAMQLFCMESDGANVDKIGHLNLGGAAHPAALKNGRVIFSSGESQGSRFGEGFTWAIWSINPDGTDWQPEISYTGFDLAGLQDAFHFQTETTDGTIAVCRYYQTRSAYGAIYGVPKYAGGDPFSAPTHFGHPLPKFNPPIADGWFAGKQQTRRLHYQRRGMYSLAPWTGSDDRPHTDAEGKQLGMLGYPMAGHGNSLYATWTGSGGDQAVDLGVYLISDAKAGAANPQALVKVVDQPGRHEWMAAPLVPYAAIHGIASPPIVTPRKMPLLPPGSPYGLVGTSEIYAPEIHTTGSSDASRNLIPVDPEEIEYIRFIYFAPSLAAPRGTFQRFKKAGQAEPKGLNFENNEGFIHYFNERTGILGDVPLKKWRTPDGTVHLGPNPPEGSTRIMNPLGTRPDSSFQAFVPADQPWTVQLINAKGEAIYGTTAPTWHQVRSVEQRTDCRGCHQHWKPVFDIEFEQTFAAQLDYSTRKLGQVGLIEYERDIKPIDQATGLDILNAPSRGYESSRATIDDSPLLTDAQARIVRKWIDTGKLRAGKWADGSTVKPEQQAGPYADTNPPTLVMEMFDDRVVLGFCDPQSGIRDGSLELFCSQDVRGVKAGASLSSLLERNDIAETATLTLEGPLPEGATLTATVRDNQTLRNPAGDVISEEGNVTEIKRTIKGPLPPYPTPPIEPAVEIAQLKAEIEELEAVLAEKRARLAELEGTP